ncbi:hypothetical protein DL93DRAFT_1364568 [Clavulina sp. PMI_390]|nr:hypothetical protein DL93DRAFT_1364568 [Clavulina sp. PMI_390]
MDEPQSSSLRAASDPAVQQQQHSAAQHENKPKCKGGVYPLHAKEFEELFSTTDISDLIVENVTHWKKDDWPFYHEFVTVKTAPRALTSTDSLPILDTAVGTRFDWSSVAEHGLLFRIDRGQRAQDPDHQYESRFDRSPLDLVEIMLPNLLVPDGVHNVFPVEVAPELLDELDESCPLTEVLRPRTITCHINLEWKHPDHFPIMTLDRLRDGDPRATTYDDPNSLRVRDFIYFLRKHADHSEFYSLGEWNCWGLASSLMRFVKHYNLDYNFENLAFPGDSLPLRDRDWKIATKNNKKVLATPLRMKIRSKGQLSNPGSFLKIMEGDHWTDGQALIDEKIWNGSVSSSN